MLAYRISDASISVMLNNQHRSIHSNHMCYADLRAHLENTPHGEHDLDKIEEWLDLRKFIAVATHGLVEVSNNEVRFNGNTVTNSLATRILEHLSRKIEFNPLIQFMDNLMRNPDKGLVDDAFAWLEAGDMPITEDGHLIAYKGVDADYRSHHADVDGTRYRHKVGDKPKMPRSRCDPDRTNTCSRGLHFCSYGYLAHGYFGGRDRVVIVKINPKDLTAIPTDYGRQKGRCCTYSVVGEIPREDFEDIYGGKRVVQTKDAPGHKPKPKKKSKAKKKKAEKKTLPRIGGFTYKQIKKEIEKLGQRGVCRKYPDIKRSTLQDFLKRNG